MLKTRCRHLCEPDLSHIHSAVAAYLAARREIEARVWSLIRDHPTLKASLTRVGGAYEVATFKKLGGRPNWTMEWITDDQLAKAAFERVVRSVQTQIELE
jgi:hypothetical protein